MCEFFAPISSAAEINTRADAVNSKEREREIEKIDANSIHIQKSNFWFS
jgi:hypothetical protein